ncbi:FG-GAP repeat domain-containing protein [Roseibacillus ishigakijimensis]|uniref:VCBS repeat-containing protein n=1 Tax=Roseibacillus ishigakijimensis TaxID=454146 RepID=A0A934VJT0_9BACT|nr:VCBS repeat-containing protein [Roseibacillus ishigakijimensis]MBK1832924.1 VCBS repeat-containing protein [Roseibacillus ishigakijimensis]
MRIYPLILSLLPTLQAQFHLERPIDLVEGFSADQILYTPWFSGSSDYATVICDRDRRQVFLRYYHNSRNQLRNLETLESDVCGLAMGDVDGDGKRDLIIQDGDQLLWWKKGEEGEYDTDTFTRQGVLTTLPRGDALLTHFELDHRLASPTGVEVVEDRALDFDGNGLADLLFLPPRHPQNIQGYNGEYRDPPLLLLQDSAGQFETLSLSFPDITAEEDFNGYHLLKFSPTAEGKDGMVVRHLNTFSYFLHSLAEDRSSWTQQSFPQGYASNRYPIDLNGDGTEEHLELVIDHRSQPQRPRLICTHLQEDGSLVPLWTVFFSEESLPFETTEEVSGFTCGNLDEDSHHEILINIPFLSQSFAIDFPNDNLAEPSLHPLASFSGPTGKQGPANYSGSLIGLLKTSDTDSQTLLYEASRQGNDFPFLPFFSGESHSGAAKIVHTARTTWRGNPPFTYAYPGSPIATTFHPRRFLLVDQTGDGHRDLVVLNGDENARIQTYGGGEHQGARLTELDRSSSPGRGRTLLAPQHSTRTPTPIRIHSEEENDQAGIHHHHSHYDEWLEPYFLAWGEATYPSPHWEDFIKDNFSTATKSTGPVPSHLLAFEDFDGDGTPDPITINSSSGMIECLFTFRLDQVSSQLGLAPIIWNRHLWSNDFQPTWPDSRHYLVADPDQDGDLDLFAAVSTPLLKPALFRNDGEGNFTREELAGPSSLLAELKTGNMDGNGIPDLVLFQPTKDSLGNPGSGLVTVLLDWGREEFQIPINQHQSERDYFPSGYSEGAMGVGDLDGDGLDDLILNNGRGSDAFGNPVPAQIFVLTQTAPQEFRLWSELDIPGLADCNQIEIHDYDGDDRNDVLLSSEVDGRLIWLKNSPLPNYSSYEEWAATRQLPANSAADNADGDQLSNFEEWVHGTDPHVSDRENFPSRQERHQPGQASHLHFSLDYSPPLAWSFALPAALHEDYEVILEKSVDLQNWHRISGEPVIDPYNKGLLRYGIEEEWSLLHVPGTHQSSKQLYFRSRIVEREAPSQ